MRYIYNKLVRDKIPSNINSCPDKNATYKILSDEEYITELNKKLLEESNEFVCENDIEELADLLEVIETIMKVKNLTWDEVRKIQMEKKEKKGGFENKIYLESVDE